MKKGLIAALFFAVLVVALAAVFVSQRIESLVVAALEQVGSDASGRPVSLEQASLSFTPGETTDLNLRLIQPGGFSPDAPFKFDEVRIAIDVAGAFSNPAVIHEMIVWSPYITYRLEAGDTPSEAPQAGPARGFTIETLRFQKGVLLVSAPGLIGRDLTLDLPDMEMHEVGPSSEKATPGGLLRQTIDRALEGLAEDSEEPAERLARSLEDLGESLRAQAQAWRERLGKAADDAGQAIKDLLKDE